VENDAPQRPTEEELVELWRLAELLRAGYPVPLAEQIAARHDVDLHQAVELVQAGCPPATAAAIVL
jgi:hypothetical protein